VEPGSFRLPTARFPIVPSSKPTDVDSIAEAWVKSFNKVLNNPKLATIPELFLEESYWRDQLCLSWDFHTLKGPDNIVSLLKQSKTDCRIKSFALDKSSKLRSPSASVIDADGKVHTVQAFLTVETDIGRGSGIVRLVQEHGSWKVFTLYTFLKELKDHEELVRKRRPNGVAHGEHLSRKNWLDRRTAEESFEDCQEPTVLILGNSIYQCLATLLTIVRCWTSWTLHCSQTQDAGHQVLDCGSRGENWRQLAFAVSPAGFA
jgi:hypothetical protein